MEKEIILRDMRDGFAWFNNLALDDYACVLGADMWSVYTLYCRRAMNTTQSTKIAQEVVASHLKISMSTVCNAIRACEWLGLIEVQRRHRSMSVVYLCNPKPMTSERIEKIYTRIDSGSKYTNLRKTLCERLQSHKSLSERIDEFVSKSTPTKLKVINRSDVLEEPSPPINGHDRQPEPKEWLEIKSRVEMQIPKAAFDNWLRAANARLTDNTLTIIADTPYAKDWIEHRLINVIQRAANDVLSREVDILVEEHSRGSNRTPSNQ